MELVIVRGGGDIASGIIHRLHRAGFKILVLEIEKPLSIRREVSFSEAIYRGQIEIEGTRGVFLENLDNLWEVIDNGHIPVYIDPSGEAIEILKPTIVVDSILAKVNLGTHRGMAPITIGVGPGFEAGVDVDLVIETKRGHYLGKVIERGLAAKNTGIPGNVLGYREERVIRAVGDGIFTTRYKIGDRVEKGDIIGHVGDNDIVAEIDGIIRGLLMEGLYVKNGLKIGDIDPRGQVEYAFTISDKARAVGGGVLEGILYLKQRGVNHG